MKENFKIAIVVNEFPTLSETFIINQITFLIDRGHEVTIYSRSKGNLDRVHPQILEYRLLESTIFIPPIPRKFTKRLYIILKSLATNFNWSYFIEILKCLNFFKLGKHGLSLYVAYNFIFLGRLKEQDIIHAHFGTSGLWMSFYKKIGVLKNIPLIVSFHGFDLSPNEEKLNRNRYKNLFQFASQLTVNSPYGKKLLNDIGFQDNNKIFHLPVGLDLDKFSKKPNIPKKSINILFCGRLIPLKGANLAIEIMHVLVKEHQFNGTLTIIGDGPQYPDLIELTKKYNLGDRVRFTKGLLQEKIIQEFNQADIFLFPGINDPDTGRCETQGLVVQEAQAINLPVVVSDVGGIKYGMVQGETGFVVPKGDVKEFVKALKKLIEDDQLREVMGKAGREFVESNYSHLKLGESLEQLYRINIEN
ncbi:glycosyltransferase family 4 protein [Cognataquiflexum aquatile]|uniref:glycosyltransferase family 4 protein n=1 Tax=Cognataquiflexum aquatile TaxID=2249427 RepID=UPI001300226F|nr:glycosyltransferase family 4 protein [Cognataquiflexum aquatile]